MSIKMNTKNKKAVLISGLIFFLFVLSLYFDGYIAHGISYLKNNFLNEFFIGLTFTSSEIIIFFFLTSLFLWSENKRKWILPLWFTLMLSSLVSFILKVVIQRPRPFQCGIIELAPFLIKNSYYIWDFSFPSAQTMLVFSAIPLLLKEFPKFKWIWMVLAGLVAFSRLYFGFHFLSDVIAGAFFGYMIGALVIKTEKENRFWEKIYWRIYDKFVK